MENKVILMDSSEAAKEQTVTAWISSKGRLFTDEHAARYDGCTHQKCRICGELCLKHWISCESCRDKQDKELFLKMPAVEWDEKTPICVYRSDQYFYSYDEILDYCEANQLDPLELMLVLCVPVEPRTLDEDFFEDCIAEDQELPESFKIAIKEFNQKISDIKNPVSWIPGNKRILTKVEKNTNE